MNLRRERWWTRMACTVIVAMACGTHAGARQDPATSTLTPPVRVRVTTITAFTVPLAGQLVRVVDGVVSEIASPRLLILSGSGPSVPLRGSGTVAVILEMGTTMIPRGHPVIVTGVVRASVAQQDNGRALFASLTSEERDAIGRHPVVVASTAKSLRVP